MLEVITTSEGHDDLTEVRWGIGFWSESQHDYIIIKKGDTVYRTEGSARAIGNDYLKSLLGFLVKSYDEERGTLTTRPRMTDKHICTNRRCKWYLEDHDDDCVPHKEIEEDPHPFRGWIGEDCIDCDQHRLAHIHNRSE